MKTRYLFPFLFLLLVACTAAPARTGNACVVHGEPKRGGDSIGFAISGPNRDRVVVDLSHGGETYDVWMTMLKRFIDSDEVYIHQTYFEDFKMGPYTVTTVLNGVTNTRTVNLPDNSSLVVYVYCP